MTAKIYKATRRYCYTTLYYWTTTFTWNIENIWKSILISQLVEVSIALLSSAVQLSLLSVSTGKDGKISRNQEMVAETIKLRSTITTIAEV